MKITIITSPFGCIPPHAIGAIEKRWYNVSKELIRNGHTVQFVAKHPAHDTNIRRENIDGIDIRYLRGYSWKQKTIYNILLDLIYSVRALFLFSKTDMLVLNTFWTPLLCALFRWKYKGVMYNVARFPKGQFKYFKYVDRLSCVSTAVYEELIRQSPERTAQAKTIPNPVDLINFAYEEKVAGDAFVISYAGRVHPEKGLDLLVAAFDRLTGEFPERQFSLRIVGATDIARGGGGKEYVDRLVSLTRQPITFVDPIYTPAALAEEVKKADVFCYPSVAEKGETFGVAPLEAMALGRPTIVSDLACFKDFVRRDENALVFDHRENAVDNLYQKMQMLYLDGDLRDEMGKKAAQTATHFSNQNIARLYIDDFEKLIKAR